MRNPLSSWFRGDSHVVTRQNLNGEADWYIDGNWVDPSNLSETERSLITGATQKAGLMGSFAMGEKDMTLATRLTASGSEHRKFLRQLPVIMDIEAPLYWWKQMDQYKVGTVTDSCSTMHTLTKAPFKVFDFSVDFNDLPEFGGWFVNEVIGALNKLRDAYNETGDKVYWETINQLLPQSYNQRRTWSANYETLRTICKQRSGHKLGEWSEFIEFVRTRVPYAPDLIFDSAA